MLEQRRWARVVHGMAACPLILLAALALDTQCSSSRMTEIKHISHLGWERFQLCKAESCSRCRIGIFPPRALRQAVSDSIALRELQRGK